MLPELAKLLEAMDGFFPPSYSADQAARWPEGTIDQFVAAGLLQEGEAALELFCPECGATEDILPLPGEVGKIDAYLNCRQHGLVYVPAERLRRWEMSYGQFLDAAFAGVPLEGRREEIVKDRVWRLGSAYWGGAQRSVYFAKALHRRDAPQLLAHANITPRSILFVAWRLPPNALDQGFPILLPLTSLLSWTEQRIHFNLELAQAEISAIAIERALSDSDDPKGRSRRDRPWVIDALITELTSHLQAAREYALETSKRGDVQLLPRPQQEFLGRKLGVDKSTISRALKHKKARDLRLLWDTADDLDRILGLSASRR